MSNNKWVTVQALGNCVCVCVCRSILTVLTKLDTFVKMEIWNAFCMRKNLFKFNEKTSSFRNNRNGKTCSKKLTRRNFWSKNIFGLKIHENVRVGFNLTHSIIGHFGSENYSQRIEKDVGLHFCFWDLETFVYLVVVFDLRIAKGLSIRHISR